MNIFRLIGDLSHLAAIIILLFRIHNYGSCTGISGKTQILFALVFTTRYIDLMLYFVSVYNSIMKVIFILTSYYTVYLIYCRYKKTYEANNDGFRYEFLILTAGILSLLYNHEFTKMEILWTFSIYLEAVAILPQLYMFYNTKDVSMFPSHYVFALGSYRAYYIANWVFRYYNEGYYDLIAISAGIVQTLLYLDFFCVYLTNLRRSESLQTVIV